jgi:hypothetical protein
MVAGQGSTQLAPPSSGKKTPPHHRRRQYRGRGARGMTYMAVFAARTPTPTSIGSMPRAPGNSRACWRC